MLHVIRGRLMSRWRSAGSLDRPSGLELVLIRSFPRCMTPMCQTLYHLCPTRYTTCHDISVCLSFGNSVLIESGSKELHCIDLAKAYELSIGSISVYDSLLESSSRTATYPKF